MLIEHSSQDPAATTAPEPETTAVTDPENPTTPDQTETEKAPEKVFKQEDIDAAVGKARAIERRKLEREYATRSQQTIAPPPTGNLTADQFETYEDYAEALATRKAAEMVQQRDVQQQKNRIQTAHANREEEARTRHDDFDQVVRNPYLPITDAMAETIMESDTGPDVAYWLGSNPAEAERISQMSPLQQAREIGKIEAKIASDPPVKKTTSAPAPINPVTARGSTKPNYDTTDPRSTGTMTPSQWIEAENQREIKKLNKS